ncbi:MAG: hypothetical protein HQM14_11250 [SAR324 cluster bacterium]|nr:hypothetical protein [SAR324 cluster bacterium]
MKIKNIKRYQTEIVFTFIGIGLLVAVYMVFLQYSLHAAKQQKLASLQKEVQQTQQQMTRFAPMNESDEEEWKKLREQFVELYPPPIDLPSNYTYDAVKKEFYGSGMPLGVTEIPLYQAISQVTDAVAISKIEITRQKSSQHPEAHVNELLAVENLNLKFVSQYKNVLQFMWELSRLPLVLEVTSLTMAAETRTPLNKNKQEIGVEMVVQYFHRKSEHVFEGWQ